MSREDLRVYRAEGSPRDAKFSRPYWLSTYPPWRAPLEDDHSIFRRDIPEMNPNSRRRGSTYVGASVNQEGAQDDEAIDATPSEEELINLALILRRPLLVVGPPGVGKSTLAYHIAWRLGLGEPLRWEINSRTTLKDGLYEYRAVEHLRDIQSLEKGEEKPPTNDYITLGPLGTAFVPSQVPRVLLIDELDKAQFDLPNDLLHILEEARFSIKELLKEERCTVYPHDYQTTEGGGADQGRVTVKKGTIQTYHHPVVVITSNGDRPFPPAFLRRCVQLKLEVPREEQLKRVLHAQFKDAETLDQSKLFESEDELNQVIDQVLKTLSDGDDLPTDQHIQRLFAQVAFGIDPWVTDFATKR